MAAALLRLAQDRPLATEWGRAGRRAVIERFSLDAMVGAYATIYDGLLAHRG